MPPATNRIDLTSLSVIHNHLVNICREMGTAMMRTSYSPIFNEGLDFSCVLFNRDGQMIAQAEFCPAQLGAILFTVKWTIAELGLDSFEEGDVVIHNDPYRGGCHMPEHMVLKPIFYNGELFGFAANIGHVAEIGGMAPGSFAATATEVFQEGLRLPLVKIIKRGEYVKDLWKLVLANHRTPRSTWGDFHAMIGSLHIAEKRVHRLLDKYGTAFVNEACQELMDHAERWMREEIRRMPDGEYSFEDVMEDDGATENPTYFRVTMVIRGDEIIADWSRSDPQARGVVNATFGVTASATYNAIFHVTDKNIPHNSGCYRPIRLIAPPGTCVNVRYPGPSVAGNTESHPRMVDLIALPRPKGGRPATFCSGACTPRPANTTPTTTSRAAAGAAGPSPTATTPLLCRTATAGIRRLKSSRRATRSSPTRIVLCRIPPVRGPIAADWEPSASSKCFRRPRSRSARCSRG
jgi:N-methylhydantoinase B